MFRLASMFAGLAGFVLMQSTSPALSVPFMDVFNHREPAVPTTERSVQLDGGPGRTLAAFVVTPTLGRSASSRDREKGLPAVILASGREGLTDMFRKFARELSGLGYVTLAVDFRGAAGAGDSPLLAAVFDRSGDLLKVTDWVAAQPGVDPDRIGAVAWNDSFDAVKKLAATGKVTAVYPERIESQSGIAEHTFVDIYEFLGSHVEDAAAATPTAPADTPVARIVDVMRAIMSDQGVRGRLARELESAPATDAQWQQAQADAAILAEAGTLLLAQQPPKGSPAGWRQRATEFKGAARVLADALGRHDFAAAQDSLRELPRACAACHAEYR
jgi:dienelactone hydrolase